MREGLTSAVGEAVRDNLVGNLGVAAGLVGAVTHSIAKVGLGTQACSVGVGAAERVRHAEQIVDAGLLKDHQHLAMVGAVGGTYTARGQAGDILGQSSAGSGEENERLHLVVGWVDEEDSRLYRIMCR